MRATAAEGIELLDLSSRLRKIGEWFTFAVNGWQIPDAARAALGIPTAPPGEETVAELQKLRSRLLDFANLEPPAGIGWVADPLERAAEASRLRGEINDAILERRDSAAAAFRQAAEDYTRCGMTAEAEKAARQAAASEDAASGDVEAQIAAAQEAADKAPPGTLDWALCRITLGELLLQAGDTFRARSDLRQAESGMAAAGHSAPPDGVAPLLGMMSGMFGLSGAASVQHAGEALSLRLAFHRLFDGLARALDPVDKEAAAEYRRKIEYYRLLTPNPFGS